MKSKIYLHKNTKNNFSNLDNLSLENYNDSEFAKKYSELVEANSINALYERPATLSLVDIKKGMKVLEAGCGTGIYTEWLAEKGAEVTAIDFSDEMLKIAKAKGTNAKFIKANLNHPLDYLNDNEFDLVLSSLVIHYIKDLQFLFSEFNRVLKINGSLVFSTHHPFQDYRLHPESNYYETELIEDKWSRFNINMKLFRRPLSEIFRILKVTDFKIDELLEPGPPEEIKESFPDLYNTISIMPCFIFFKAIKIN